MNRVSSTLLLFPCCLIAATLSWGCSSSQESAAAEAAAAPPAPSATEVMTGKVNTLTMQNDSLKLRIASLEQANRSSVAHAAELETQLNDLKSRPATPPQPVKQSVAPSRSTAGGEEGYENALHEFRARHYQEAAAIFQQLLDENAMLDLMDNCRYWLGECAYAMKQYQVAIAHFRKVFDYKVSEKKDDAQIMIANCYYAMGDKENAKKEYQTFLEKFPASPYAQRAKERLGKL